MDSSYCPFCFPGWQTVYDNDLYEIFESNGGNTADRKRITGGEVALWTETVSHFLKVLIFQEGKKKK